MKNDDLVDVQSLAKRLQKEGVSAFLHWTETAHDIARDKYKEINRIHHDYSTLQKEELLLFRYESFINVMLDAMPTLEAKKTLLEIEAPQEKKF